MRLGSLLGSDDATPVTADYRERDNGFTGRIHQVTIEVQPMGAAVRTEADAAKKEADLKVGLSN